MTVAPQKIHFLQTASDEGIRSTGLKFADDTKLVARVGSGRGQGEAEAGSD